MSMRNPILLSFYGLTNGKRTVLFGKLAYSPLSDLSFKAYNRFKTFKSVVALYNTRPIRNQEFDIQLDHGTVRGQTDTSGSFWCETETNVKQTKLERIVLLSSGERVWLTENLYPNTIQTLKGSTLIISDLDDTLIDSFVSSKLKQLKTLLFTTVEKRTAVVSAAAFIRKVVQTGASAFYLSNSEQNLYPLLYRFLMLNEFPPGPLFLRQYIHLRHWAWQKISRKKNLHKRMMLEKIVELFPEKRYILLGDNTQHDLQIYLDFVSQHPEKVKHVIIREVRTSVNTPMIVQAKQLLTKQGIGFYFGTQLHEDVYA